MPFVLAHPAACLPLHRLGRGRLDLAALVIGSMVPDVPWFLPVGLSRTFTHSGVGWLVFCLPVGALALVVWRRLVRPLVQPLTEPVFLVGAGGGRGTPPPRHVARVENGR